MCYYKCFIVDNHYTKCTSYVYFMYIFIHLCIDDWRRCMFTSGTSSQSLHLFKCQSFKGWFSLKTFYIQAVNTFLHLKNLPYQAGISINLFIKLQFFFQLECTYLNLRSSFPMEKISKVFACLFCFLTWTSPGGNTPQDTNCTATCLLSWKLFKLDEPDMQDTAGEAGTNS